MAFSRLAGMDSYITLVPPSELEIIPVLYFNLCCGVVWLVVVLSIEVPKYLSRPLQKKYMIDLLCLNSITYDCTLVHDNVLRGETFS